MNLNFDRRNVLHVTFKQVYHVQYQSYIVSKLHCINTTLYIIKFKMTEMSETGN